MKKTITMGAVFLATLALDIFTKYMVVYSLGRGNRLDYAGGFFRINLVYNEGGVFGILQGYKTLFLVVSVCVLVLMLVYYYLEKNKTWLFSISMSLVISGAIGNIIDRLVPGRPGVVDFISVGVDGVYRWPSFNIADSCIVVGAAFLVVVFYQQEKARKKAQLH